MIEKLKKVQLDGGFEFIWADRGIAATVKGLHRTRGHLRADVKWSLVEDSARRQFYSSTLDLTRGPEKDRLVTALDRHYDADWASMIELLCYHAEKDFGSVDEIERLRTGPEHAEQIPLLFEPFIHEGFPFVFFGDPGTGKSLIGLLIAALASVNRRIPGLDFAPVRECKALYIDYESNKADLQRRLSSLERGLGFPLDDVIGYVFCTEPLADIATELRKQIARSQTTLLIVDSLGPAAGGDLNTSETALRFFSALRSLRCTSVVLAHTAKNAGQEKRTIYGSTFFGANARGIAEVRRLSTADKQSLALSIHHAKDNLTAIQDPFGIRFRFEESAVLASPIDVASDPQFVQRETASTQILFVLSDGKPRAPIELAQEIGKSPDTVRQAVRRLAKAGEIMRGEDGTYTRCSVAERKGG